VANLLTQEVFRYLNEEGVTAFGLHISPLELGRLAERTLTQQISASQAKKALKTALEEKRKLDDVMEEQGLNQVVDSAAVLTLANEIAKKMIEKFPSQVNEYRSGKEKMIGFLVGQGLKEAAGKVPAALIQAELKRLMS
jgi:aspartyl-tRNA(Asn)/glutamyl-tRNA(Gln) amidotransferase subunit B